MKTKIAAALLAVVALLPLACEKHDWKTETSQLFKAHEEHGGAEHKAGEHDKAASHDEKKAEDHAEGEKK